MVAKIVTEIQLYVNNVLRIGKKKKPLMELIVLVSLVSKKMKRDIVYLTLTSLLMVIALLALSNKMINAIDVMELV